MAIAGQVVLKVMPENLVTKAQETARNISKLKTGFDNLESIIARTNGYWIGEAGDLHRKLYQDEKENIAQMFARLSEHPGDLEQIARTYMGVESAVEQIANELPGDIIS